MLYRVYCLTVGLIALLFLGACQSNQSPEVTSPEYQQRALENLRAFAVTGGLGVWTDTESISTRIEWKQLADDFDVMIRLPAGLSTVRVRRNGGMASVQNGSTEPAIGRSAGVLLQQALGLGIAVPIEQMSVWIKGQPGRAAESVQYDNSGRLESMNYRDEQGTQWRAKVLKYTVHEGVYVPSIILATGGPYTVRLNLKTWDSLEKLDLIEVLPEVTESRGRLKVPGR